MTFILFLAAGILAASPESPATPDQLGYEQLRKRAGRTPDDQVRLALWCEAHGLPAERLKHLALAVLTDPSHATARGLMGLVSYRGKWQSPDAVADKIKADAEQARLLAEYDDRRMKAAYTADGQWRMAQWCEEKELVDQARAHLTAVVRLDPSREQAWRRLGYTRHGNRWMTAEQVAAEKAEAEAQKLADRRWRPALEKWKGILATPARKAEAEAAMAELADPRAVPSIAKVFITARPADQAVAVRLLGQVDAPAASRALAGLAVMSAAPEVRRSAIETLRRRDPREYVRLWIALIRDPIKYEVKPVGGPGSPGELFIEGKKANVRRQYSPPAMPSIAAVPGSMMSHDAEGLPVLNLPGNQSWFEVSPSSVLNQLDKSAAGIERFNAKLAELGVNTQAQDAIRRAALPERSSFGTRESLLREQAGGFRYRITTQNSLSVPIGQMMVEVQKAAEVARRQLSEDVAAIERLNDDIHRANAPAIEALNSVTSQRLGEDAAAWSRWWTDQEGYASLIASTEQIPTITETIPLGYTPQFAPSTIVQGPIVGIERRHSCFGAGTMVRTIDGSRPIERLNAGDRVLVQDTETGALDYQPVVAVFHNPPNATLRIKLGAETVVATGIHRFWKAGKGWTMARDLKEGDTVRVVGGVAAVESIVEDRVQPVFNLEVAEGHSFFVGSAGVLVHDNSLVEPTPAPFDAGEDHRDGDGLLGERRSPSQDAK